MQPVELCIPSGRPFGGSSENTVEKTFSHAWHFNSIHSPDKNIRKIECFECGVRFRGDRLLKNLCFLKKVQTALIPPPPLVPFWKFHCAFFVSIR